MDKWRELFGMLLSLPAGAGLQLSVLQSSVRFMQNLRSYVHAMQPDEQACLLSGPLVNWSMEEVRCCSGPRPPSQHTCLAH
jgi:hypothetical protein